MKRACLIISGYLIMSAMLEDDEALSPDWHLATPPLPQDGKQAITLDNGATWHWTAARGFGTPTYQKPAPLTLGKFRDRFTFAERVAIDNAPDNTDLPAPTRAAMRTLLKDFETASQIELDHVQTIIGVRTIEDFGLLAAGRADQILTW